MEEVQKSLYLPHFTSNLQDFSKYLPEICILSFDDFESYYVRFTTIFNK